MAGRETLDEYAEELLRQLRENGPPVSGTAIGRIAKYKVCFAARRLVGIVGTGDRVRGAGRPRFPEPLGIPGIFAVRDLPKGLRIRLLATSWA